MRKKVFLTFGGPTQNYHNALHRICNEANNMNFFTHIIYVYYLNSLNDIQNIHQPK